MITSKRLEMQIFQYKKNLTSHRSIDFESRDGINWVENCKHDLLLRFEHLNTCIWIFLGKKQTFEVECPILGYFRPLRHDLARCMCFFLAS